MISIYCMMTSSNGNIFPVTGPLYGESTCHMWIPAQRPVTRSCDVFFDLRPNKRLSKQWWGWWFETSSRPLWRDCNGLGQCIFSADFAAICIYLIPLVCIEGTQRCRHKTLYWNKHCHAFRLNLHKTWYWNEHCHAFRLNFYVRNCFE